MLYQALSTIKFWLILLLITYFNWFLYKQQIYEIINCDSVLHHDSLNSVFPFQLRWGLISKFSINILPWILYHWSKVLINVNLFHVNRVMYDMRINLFSEQCMINCTPSLLYKYINSNGLSHYVIKHM